MRKKVMKTGLGRAKEILPKLDSELFKKVVSDFIELSGKNIIFLDVLPYTFTMSYSEEIQKTFFRKYNINKATFSDMIETFSNILHNLLEETEEDFLRELGDEQLAAKAKDLSSFVENMNQFSDIKSRYLLVQYCKTRFLGEIDWEINLKSSQKEAGEKKEAPVFPFCVARLSFESSFSRQKGIAEMEPEIVTVELSLSDVIKLSETFSEIREKMRKIASEKLAECKK